MSGIELKEWIKGHEGLRLKPYLDSAGKLTVGHGRNIEDLGISEEEADFLLDNDIQRCRQQLDRYSWYRYQPQSIQYSLINMCFNLGITKLLGFKRMIQALEEKDYQRAAMEALDSKWAAQVGKRASDIALKIRNTVNGVRF